MQRNQVFGLVVLIIFSISGFPQGDPLQGRWEGTVRSQMGERPARVVFKKDGAGYTGTLSGLQENSEIPFRDAKLDGDKINVKVQVDSPRGSVTLNIGFVVKGESLQGKGNLNLGGQNVDLTYDLKRAGDLAQSSQPATPAVPPKPQFGQAGSQAELDDYNKLRSATDASAKKQLIGEFVQKYPESGLTAHVHQEGAYLGQQTNDFEMMVDHGEKSLAAMPENAGIVSLGLMTMLGNAYAERGVVDKAEQKAELAIEQLASTQKPPQATEEQWAQAKSQILGTNFSTLGYVQLRRAQSSQNPAERKAAAERAIAPFKKALEQQRNDDISYWRLGVAYVFLNDYSNAESNLAKAVAINGLAAGNARSILEDIYKGRHKDSLEGLDKVIAKAKGDLGLP